MKSFIVDQSPRAGTVVIVNGTQDMLDVLDTVLEPGHYDVVISDSTNDAYSLIKRIRPHLVFGRVWTVRRTGLSS